MVYPLIALLLLILITGSQVIAARNPVYSVFWLVLTFVETTLLFIYLGLDFIALMTVIVYVGAIAILFLFVVLMLQLGQADPFPWMPFFPALIITNTFIFAAAYIHHIPLNSHHAWQENFIWNPQAWNNIQAIGFSLYAFYPLLFIGAGFILLVAMVGAMLLSKTSSSQWLRQQSSWAQIHRSC